MPPRDGKPPAWSGSSRACAGTVRHAVRAAASASTTARSCPGCGARRRRHLRGRRAGRRCGCDTPVAARRPRHAHHGDVRRWPRATRVPFVLTWHPSHERRARRGADAAVALPSTEVWWDWVVRLHLRGPHWQTRCVRSLITLKALTYAPTGGIVAAATTSLPEDIGGVRNWDYRYCWLRDATFTLDALLDAGYAEEATAWRRLAAAGHRRRPGRAPDHVRRRRRAAPDRVGASTGCRATRARRRCASATPPSSSSSSTCTAR